MTVFNKETRRRDKVDGERDTEEAQNTEKQMMRESKKERHE